MAEPDDPLARFNARRWGETPVFAGIPRLRKLAKQISRLPPGRLLDIGCGDGGFSEQFLSLGWKVFGIDLETGQLEEARLKGIQAKGCNLMDGIPFPDGSFTAVAAGEVIEHLVDTDRLLEEAYRVLEPGGFLFLTTANLAALNNRVRLLLGMYPNWMDYSVRDGVGHVRYYTPGILRRQLLKHGFQSLRFSSSWVPLVPTRWALCPGYPKAVFPLSFFLGDLFPSLGMEIIVACRHP